MPVWIAHRTKAGAEAAMLAMVPEGRDPWAYAQLRVEQIATGEPQVRVVE